MVKWMALDLYSREFRMICDPVADLLNPIIGRPGYYSSRCGRVLVYLQLPRHRQLPV